VRLAELTGHLDAHLQGLGERQARHWRTLRDADRPALFGRGRPDMRTAAAVLARAYVGRAARLLPGQADRHPREPSGPGACVQRAVRAGDRPGRERPPRAKRSSPTPRNVRERGRVGDPVAPDRRRHLARRGRRPREPAHTRRWASGHRAAQRPAPPPGCSTPGRTAIDARRVTPSGVRANSPDPERCAAHSTGVTCPPSSRYSPPHPVHVALGPTKTSRTPHRHIHPTTRAGTPRARAWSGTSSVTTAPAPMKA
jgi:hypothetical protein